MLPMRLLSPSGSRFFTARSIVVALSAGIGAVAFAAEPTAADQARLKVVTEFANHVLADASDHVHSPATALLANGVNVDTHEQVQWVFPSGKTIILSDLTVQQNLFRVLTGLTNLTGEAKYKAAAKAEIAYYFAHFQDSGGLLHWGGHNFVDLRTLAPIAVAEKSGVHELKNVFPYYDLMYETDPAATVKYITAFWNAHVYNWQTLEVSRHGEYGRPPGANWDQPFNNPPPYFETKGLSFLDAGNDLIYSAAMLSRLAGDKGALLWSKRLAEQYVKARDPKTHLGAYQYTQSKKTGTAPSDDVTLSWFGDRANRQFGPDFPQHRVLEATMLLNRLALTIYSHNALMQLQLAEALGDDGRDFKQWTHDGMAAFVHYAYIPADNTLRPMLTDGTDLTGFTLKRNGYYGRAGITLKAYPATAEYLISYARGFLVTGDPDFWTMARGIARAQDLGDIGRKPGEEVQVNRSTHNTDPHALFAVLDLYRRTKCTDYLELGRILGDNLVRAHYHHGYFTPHDDSIFASVDAIDPLALLALEAAIRGQPDLVPEFVNSAGYVDSQYRFSDGTSQGATDAVLYRPRHSTSPVPVPGVRNPNGERID
jgi:pectate lyase